jgi:hypothetical protein
MIVLGNQLRKPHLDTGIMPGRRPVGTRAAPPHRVHHIRLFIEMIANGSDDLAGFKEQHGLDCDCRLIVQEMMPPLL